MDMRNREALLHQVMDNLVAQVRQWKDTSHGHPAYQDLCSNHKDDIYRLFRDSGLQPWEFHTMLHRASEYGLVEDMKGLWSEVATTFLQIRSGYATDTPQHQRQPLCSSTNSNNSGTYAAWPTNGRSSNSGYTKPPGLEADRSGAGTPPGVQQQQSQYSVPPPPPAGPRSPADDTTGGSSDQHSSKKQQQKVPTKSKASKGGNQPAANGSVTAAQQQQRPCPSAATGNSTKAASSDVLPNGYISAWRNSMAPAQAPAGVAGVLGQRYPQAGYQTANTALGNSGVDQQQQHKSNPTGQRTSMGSSAAAGMQQDAAAAGGWEVQEPLDLLPSGLLDDVYDQGDAVVDAPPAYSALATHTAATGAASSGAVDRGSSGRCNGAAAAPGGRSQQQQGKQQRQQQQPQQQQNQPQQLQSQQNAAVPSEDQQVQQQGSTRLQQGRQQQQQQSSQPSQRSPLLESSSTKNDINGVLGGPFSPPRAELKSPLCVMQHHQPPAVESLAQHVQQQQQFMMLQQQARMYQQQIAGLNAWGAAGHLGYANPFAAVPMQPPPPPRNAAAAAAGPAAAAADGAPASCAPPPPAAAPAGAAQQAPVKPGYAAVAAAAAPGTQKGSSSGSSHDESIFYHDAGGDASKRSAVLSSSSLDLPLYQPPGRQSLQEQQQQQHQITPSAVGPGGVPIGLSLFQTAAYDSPITPALAAGPLSPYPSPLHRSLSASTGASPVAAALAGPGGSTGLGSSGHMAPMLLPPSAATLGVIGEPVHSSAGSSHFAGQQQDALLAGSQPVQSWSGFGPTAVGRPATDPVVAPPPLPPQHQQCAPGVIPTMTAAVSADQQQQAQSLQLPESSLALVSVLAADGSTSSAASSVTAPTATSVATTPHSQTESPARGSSSMGPAIARQASVTAASPTATSADAGARQPPPPPPPPPPPRSTSSAEQMQLAGSNSSIGGSSPRTQGQQPPAPPAKPLTWAQKLLHAQSSSSSSSNHKMNSPAVAGAAVTPCVAAAAAHHAPHGPRIAPAPKSEVLQQSGSGAAAAGTTGKQRAGTTGQILLAVAKQQEAEAEAAAATAVPTYSESAALDGLDAITAKAAVSAASRMPLPAKVIQAWRSGLCLASLIKLLQSQRQDLAMALNDRIKGWLTQDCDRTTAECLVLFVLVNLRRDWHLTAKSPGAFLMGLLQHRAALISGSGMARKLLDTARNFPNVAVYIDSDVLQELGDMDASLRSFIMDEYMCKQRHDWPEGLKFPSQCLLSCMRSIRYADPAVHKAYAQLMETRPDLGKAMNGVILYGLCKCDSATGLAAVKRLKELPEEWTSAARVNASAFLYQKVQELCGGHCY